MFEWVIISPFQATRLVAGMFSGNCFINKDGRPTMCYYPGDWKDEQFHPTFHEKMRWVDNSFFAPESLLDDRGRRIMRAWIFDSPGFATRTVFRWWPAAPHAAADHAAHGAPLAAHQLQVLLAAGDPEATQAAPVWRAVGYPAELGAAD